MNNDGVEVKVDPDGTKAWYLNHVRHRTDGPAVERADGTKEWYLNGKLHRTDGPAVERYNGNKEWYLNGKLHRTDGPAVERTDGYKAWFLNGDLHRTDGPAVGQRKSKKTFSSPVYINICAQIDAGDYDDDLAYSAEAYRAGAAASAERIKKLKDGILDITLYIEELADIEDWRETVADGGITVDMIVKQYLKTVIASTLRRLLNE